MAIDKSLMSGSMTMLILKLLSEKDMYGYEMIDTLRQKSQNVFQLKAGTLYPLLHGMEEPPDALSVWGSREFSSDRYPGNASDGAGIPA